MKSLSTIKFLILSWLLAPILGNGQGAQLYATPVFTDSGRLARVSEMFPSIEKIYSEYAAKNHFPGYSFGIMLDGKLVYSGSGGYANLESKIPASTSSMFRIASMSKSFTAMAILHLRDAGKLRLDDLVTDYIPELKGQQLTADAAPMRIRDLLTHAAGFPEDNPWGDRQLADSNADLLALIQKGLRFSNVPGVTYEYSNLGFAMLGYIIQQVSGMPYSDYIAQNIWKPLKMDAASWEYSKVSPNALVHGYRWINDSWRDEPLLHDGIYGAMGGMITSIESFSKYVALHQSAWPASNAAETGPLKRSSIREMHQPWRFNTLQPNYRYYDNRACAITTAYGYGLSWTRDCEARVIVAHSGGLPGFGSNWRFLPEYGLGVILFANVTYANTGAVNLQVLDKIIRTAGLTPRTLPASAILKDRQAALMRLLPLWTDAAVSGLFAENFFEDYELSSLQKSATELFRKAGRITSVGEVVAENQLRGYFILRGEKGQLRISFTLTPENPALIQEYNIEEVRK